MSQFLFEPNNPLYGDYTVTIATTDWTLDNGTYTHSWSNARIAPLNEVEIEFITDPETVLTSDLLYDKLDGSLLFSSVNLPSGSLTLQIKIIKHHLDSIFDLVYPIGSIYMSVNNTNPGALFGGTWVLIEDRFLLAAGSTYIAGNTGGEATHQLIETEIPSHTHSRGTMNITGYIGLGWGDNSATSTILGRRAAGALYGRAGDINGKFANSGLTYNKGAYSDELVFDASRNWTGSTSSYGNDGAHNNMPPYLTVYMWKRTA